MLIETFYCVSHDGDGILLRKLKLLESVLQTNLIEVVQDAAIADLRALLAAVHGTRVAGVEEIREGIAYRRRDRRAGTQALPQVERPTGSGAGRAARSCGRRVRVPKTLDPET